MRVKSVVKVMNFHSLLRVEKSRTKADIYSKLIDHVENVIDIISNNKNIILDKKINLVKEDNPILNIYIGSDFGFCGSVNSLVNKAITEDLSLDNIDKIIIGRRVKKVESLLYIEKESFVERYSEIYDLIADAIKHKKYSKINVVYNHYYDITNIKLLKKQIFPMEMKEKNVNNKEIYNGDFEVEGRVEDILRNLFVSYINYMVKIAYVSSLASENISRQNLTTESLKRIDEKIAEDLYEERKVKQEKSFRKTVDAYINEIAMGE